MINYMCRRGRAHLKQEFLLNFIKNIQQQNLSTAEFILYTKISYTSLKWIPSNKIIYLYRDSNMPYLSHYLQATTLSTRPPITW